MPVPNPTPIFRLVHIDNLRVLLQRGGMHAPNNTPKDGLPYKTIHRMDIQSGRHARRIPCGPRGTIHDYVSFYFGYLSPMLLQLKTGQVEGYDEGQEPLIYLVSTAQGVHGSRIPFVFSDGHGLPEYTKWFDELHDLDKVDWDMVYQRHWADDPTGDNDRQRRKQAEFLVHRVCNWTLIDEIGVLGATMRSRVRDIMDDFADEAHRPVRVHSEWYY